MSHPAVIIRGRGGSGLPQGRLCCIGVTLEDIIPALSHKKGGLIPRLNSAVPHSAVTMCHVMTQDTIQLDPAV